MYKAPPIFSAYQALLSKGRLQTNPAQQALVKQLGQLQQSLVSRTSPSWTNKGPQHQTGVYIYGGVGTGKSRIADLFASTLPQSITSRRIHFHEFMVDVHSRLHQARSCVDYTGDPLIRIGKQIRSESSVLCFDEFQVSDIADAMILKRLFGSFWGSGGVMVSTSNRHPTELYLNGLNRPLFIPFVEELQRRCLVWKMEGEHDYRLGGTQEGEIQVFFTNATAFHESMSRVLNGVPLKPFAINVVMNRSITVLTPQSVPRSYGEANGSSKAVVYGTFSSLCEASLGPSDYHAVCNFAETIFMSGLRQLAADELDFVRRFITLVDIAYESRTRIICLSDAPLIEVFQKIGIIVHAPLHQQALNEDRSIALAASENQSGYSLLVKGEGGSSSSMMSTFVNNVEWSATGLSKASLASGGAGETDVRFAVGRAISRLSEMGSVGYGSRDD